MSDTVITESLLRKRAEHNDGCLFDLREITLHQQNLTKIDQVGKFCKHLEILFLQCNRITRIENLQALKRLSYLNLAVNGITTIENLERCESLSKLDFTANYIDDVHSLFSLQSLYNLKELYLVGNPICDLPDYRLFVISVLPQLVKLDGIDVDSNERITADNAKKRLLAQALEWFNDRISKGIAGLLPSNWSELSYDTSANTRVCDDEAPNHLTYDELRLKEPPLYRNGKVVQVNQPKLDFKIFQEHKNTEVLVGSIVVLRVEISKFISTSLIDVNIQPKFVEIRVKDQLLRVALDDEVLIDQSDVIRSTVTGTLVIKMPKERSDRILALEKIKKVEVDDPRVKRVRTRSKEDDEFLIEVRNERDQSLESIESGDCDDVDDMPDLE
ncbi:hypothetical protein GEMRC1_009166 [Eukaryota sp. GEM-RC1]